MQPAARGTAPFRRTGAAVLVCIGLAGLTALAGARPIAGGVEGLRPVPGTGKITFTAKGPVGGSVKGVATTKVVPAAIKPGQPVRFVVDMRWTETNDSSPCPWQKGTSPSQTSHLTRFPLTSIRPGHGEDLTAGRVSDAEGTMTSRVNGATYTCGPPNVITHHEGYEARVPGSATARYTPGCYAPFPQVINLFSADSLEGTFATLSVGGVDCAGGSPAATQTFTDTFSASGQAKLHAVSVPAKKTKAFVTLRWDKASDRFTLSGIALAPKRKTSSAVHAAKLRITFFSLGPTSMRVNVLNLAPGALTFRVVGKKVTGGAKVRTQVSFKA